MKGTIRRGHVGQSSNGSSASHGRAPGLLYWTEDGTTEIEVHIASRPGCGPTLWLSLRQLASLFERDRSVISKHLKALFTSRLDRTREAAFFETTQAEGRRAVRRTLERFTTDVALAVGDRVRSNRRTHFRNWANEILRGQASKGPLDEREDPPETGLGALPKATAAGELMDRS